MSGLEILGVAASAIQVAQVGLAIVTSLASLINQLRDAPELAKTRLLQLRTLVDVSTLIEKSPQLQTTEIHAILQNCSKDAKELNDLLSKLVLEKDGSRIKKWAKAIGGVVNENKIMRLLAILEMGKASLTLCITQIDSTLLLDIDARLSEIRGNLDEVSHSVRNELPPIRAAIENLMIQHHDSNQSGTAETSKAEKTEACLASLAGRDQAPFLLQTIRRSKEAGRWIFDHLTYNIWHDSNKSDLLSITANPGCGKTTLAAHIYHQLSEGADQGQNDTEIETTKTKPVMLCFFFHRSNQKAERTATAALKTIIAQLLQKVPDLIPIALRRFESLSARGSFEWSWENLYVVMDGMLDQMPPELRVFIILDAIDECEADSKQLILDWAKGLTGDSHILGSHVPRPTTKIIITSRPDESIFDRLSHFPSIEMTESHTANDMHELIRGCVEDFSSRRCLNPEVGQRIEHFLEENAHGMFLWIVLVMEELARRDERLNDEVIVSKLSRLPTTLLNTYAAIIQIPPLSRRNDMWKIIRWLLYGRRGLKLAELETALCLETGVPNWYDFSGDLKYLCGSLIRFDGSRGEFNLIHQTARDFLERFVDEASPSDVGNIPMDPVTANDQLAKTCVQYLLSEERLLQLPTLSEITINTRCKYRSIIEGFLQRSPFLCYAIQNWSSHVNAVRIPSPLLCDMVTQLLSSMHCRDAIIRFTYFINNASLGAPSENNAIHLAAYFNFPWLVQRYLSQSPDRSIMNLTDDCEDTALIWASEMGSLECVRILLEAGADPNLVEYDGWSPLHWAARNGHLEVAELLLQHGARIDQEDQNGWRPIDWAAHSENWDVHKLLEEWSIK